MKTHNYRKLMVLLIVACAASTTGCSMLMPNGGSTAAISSSAGSGGNGGPNPQANSISSSVPNADSINARIENALTLPATAATPSPTPLVNPLQGNFKNVLLSQGSSLSSTSDPTTATGAAAVPLLVYAACNDVRANMYGINTNSSISAENNALVNAGLTIVNQCTANLSASGSSLNSQVSSIFSNLVSQDSSAGASTSQTFISVCTAATSFCVSMLGF